MNRTEFWRVLNGALDDLVVHREEVRGATFLIAPSVPAMGELAGLFTLGHWLENRGRKTRMDFARAPSMVDAWRTWAKHWTPEMRPSSSLMVPFDEIRGGKYRRLEAEMLRSLVPADSLPPTLDIDPGDGSQMQVEAEVERLNTAIADFMGADVAAFALAGTSPNPTVEQLLSNAFEAGDFEIHIAFDRPGLPHVEAPFKAIPMSTAASAQQQREDVVDEASSLEADWVVTMTGHHLATRTDSIVFSIPDFRGVNIYRMFNEQMNAATPATLIQEHPGLGRKTDFDLPGVVVCMTTASWQEYQAAHRHFLETGFIPGLG